MNIKYTRCVFNLCALILLSLWQQAAHAKNLTLKQAENAALSQSSEIRMLDARTRALEDATIVAKQLPDPKLTLGMMNVPTDTFHFNQEGMTQTQVGLQQYLPKGKSLHYRSEQQRYLTNAEQFKQKSKQLQILQTVRLHWLNIYYWKQSKKIFIKQQAIFQQLAEVVQSMLANNKAQQKDLARAQLELSELKNHILECDRELTTARVQLARWIGNILADQAHPEKLPIWPKPPQMKQLLKKLEQHPLLKVDTANISADHAGIDLAKQQYSPGMNIGVAYGLRQGRNMDGSRRANFLTVQLGIDLPLFTKNRQDRQRSISEQKLLATQATREIHFRELQKEIATQYTVWQQQKISTELYKTHLVPEAKQYAQATMIAYQNTQTDFPTLASAYLRELNTSLAGLKATVSRDIARINLLYLQGM